MKNEATLIRQFKIATHNALAFPEILQQLEQHTLNEAKVKEGKKIGQRAIQLRQQHQQLKADSKEATRLFQEAFAKADFLYGEHRTLAQVAFKDQATAWDKLNLNGSRKLPLIHWLEQAQQFYSNALPYTDTLAKYNMPQATLNEARKLVDHIETLDILRQQTKSQLQVLTQQKQEAMTELEQWMRRFYRIARVALEEQPQHLEALGLVVKA
ncbi:MAG: hypothetical protein RIG62_02845 [Cyclobacteriaceae bacterium]